MSPVSPQPGGRRAARASEQPAYTPGPSSQAAAALLRATVVAWLVTWGLATAATVGAVVDVDRLPEHAPLAGAVVLSVLFAAALARRCGGRVWFWTTLSALHMGVVLVVDQPWLRSSAAVFVAAVGGVAAVLLTRPAPTYLRLLAEYVVALVLAASAGLAVAGFDAPVTSGPFNLLVLALAMAGALALVWRLGAGFHGLGRRGLLLIVAGAVLVAAVLVYSRVLREYGSASVTGAVEDMIDWIRVRLHGVPRPIEVLVGFPALLWGVHTRARRRQGWWMCAFGAFGTATVATTLAAPMVDPAYAGRSLLYSIGLGLLIGLAVLQVDAFVTRRRTAAAAGRRARRAEPEPEALRPEPPRTQSLR
jgi:hypothetical protein